MGKEKQVELQKKIQSSNMLNQARLKVLKHRDDHVASVLEEAKQQLSGVVRDRKKYTEILQQLLTQAMCQLLESVIPASVSEYKTKVNKDCQVKIYTENWLPSDCTGGIEILAFKGKIKVDNTLEARLNMISQQILPEVRSKLFGANP